MVTMQKTMLVSLVLCAACNGYTTFNCDQMKDDARCQQGGAGGLDGGNGGNAGSVGGVGGMSSGGSGGSSAGSGGAGADGGSNPGGFGGMNMGGAPQGPVYSLHYILEDKPAQTFLGIGGLIDQPGANDVATNPFEDATTGLPCVADSSDATEVWCVLGKLEPGTKLQLKLIAWSDASGTTGPNFMCDNPGLPTSDCKGTLEIRKDGIVLDTFQDDNDMNTPLPPPWQYVTVDNLLEPVYPALP
jgi:hypothetical protein